jgi:hypothetical protein
MAREIFAIKSSAILAASYDETSQELEITFSGGRTFTLYNVPPDVAHGLRDAPSAGRYFHDHLKGQYDG